MSTVLTIAGSDPSGGAGVKADIKTFEAFGVKGLSCITAITAQTEASVTGVYPVPADQLTQQLASAVRQAKPDAVKIGMLGSAANVRAVRFFLNSARVPHVVIDPVLASTSGMPLLEPHGLKYLKDELLPLATVITPNLDEAGVLTGMRLWNIGTMKEAARIIHADAFSLKKERSPLSAKGGFGLSVLIKGGHLPGDPVDVLFDGTNHIEFPARRIAGVPRHGTGCRLSSAIAACLAKGVALQDAITEAKGFVEDYINRCSL
jgi:hydroxymethylpyrimidine/phosphomethylpyrimidine kinase